MASASLTNNKHARLEERRPGAALRSGHDVHLSQCHRVTPALVSWTRDCPAGPCTFSQGGSARPLSSPTTARFDPSLPRGECPAAVCVRGPATSTRVSVCLAPETRRDCLAHPPLQMPKDTTKPKVPSALSLCPLSLSPSHSSPSARQQKRPKRPPPAPQSPKRTQRPPSVPSPPTCSSARTGARESRPRIPTLASAKSASCSVQNGKKCQTKRKRSFSLSSPAIHAHPLPSKPYIDAAAADKARAEKDKAAYDARPPFFSFRHH